VTVSLIDTLIGESDDLRRVRRQVPGSYGAKGRYTPGADIFALVRLRMQDRSANLVRLEAGDTSVGQADVWAPLTDLAAAEDETAPGVPLGWTSLTISAPKSPTGDQSTSPPGDQITWKGRTFEVTSEAVYDGDGPLIDGFRRYIATDKGAA